MRHTFSERTQTVGICVALIVGVVLVFGQSYHFEFLVYDDPVYVTQNPWVSRGMTLDGIVAAFTIPQNAGWAPLSTLSHMMDVELFGLDPGPPHLLNVALHGINAVLVFLVMLRMTDALWPSAWVAAMFAFHPLRVESVVWISSRKDVLCALFALVSVASYVEWIRQRRSVYYAATVLSFAAALLAKPMAVPLPFALLLFDVWPLRRFGRSEKDTVGRAIMEKVPLFALTAIVCAVTIWAQHSGGAMRSLEQMPLAARLWNAIVSTAAYLDAMVWPVDLAAVYPLPKSGVPASHVLVSGAVLTVITLVALISARSQPAILWGWLWYLGWLVPVIGLVKIGAFARADRYTYIPLIGLFVAVAWFVSAIPGTRLFRIARGVAACFVVVLCGVLTARYAAFWRNSEALFEETLRVTKENAAAHNNLGVALLLRSREPEAAKQVLLARAERHFTEALRIEPEDVDARMNLGLVYLERERWPMAAMHLRQAVALGPSNPYAHYNLGLALRRYGNDQEASLHFAEAVRLNPLLDEARRELANTSSAVAKPGGVSGAKP